MLEAALFGTMATLPVRLHAVVPDEEAELIARQTVSALVVKKYSGAAAATPDMLRARGR
jgi:hypothetical protein